MPERSNVLRFVPASVELKPPVVALSGLIAVQLTVTAWAAPRASAARAAVRMCFMCLGFLRFPPRTMRLKKAPGRESPFRYHP